MLIVSFSTSLVCRIPSDFLLGVGKEGEHKGTTHDAKQERAAAKSLLRNYILIKVYQINCSCCNIEVINNRLLCTNERCGGIDEHIRMECI